MSFWSEYVERSEATTVVVDDKYEDTRTSNKLRLSQTIVSSLCLLITTLYFIYILHQSRQVRRKPTQRTIFKLFVGHVLSASVANLVILVLSVVNIESDAWRWCSFLGSLPSPCYVLSHGCNYLIFLKRSKTVYTGSSRLMRLFNLFTLFGTYGMLFTNACVFILLRGLLLPNNVCVQTFPWWLSVLILAADTSLTTVFLFLFIYPLRQQAHALRTCGQGIADSTKRPVTTSFGAHSQFPLRFVCC